MSVKQIANYLGVTEMTVYSWRSGRHPIPKMAKLAMIGVEGCPDYLKI